MTTTMKFSRVDGCYVCGDYCIFSVIVGDTRKEWRVEKGGELVTQCGSLKSAKRAAILHAS